MGRTINGRKKGKFVFVFFAIVAGIFLLVALLQYLWNILIPEIFGIKMISYWQAFGLLILSKILFGRGFGKPGGGFKKHRQLDDNLSDKEREKLKSEWRRRFEDRFKC